VAAQSHRVIIVDDHPLFRDALRQALTNGLKDLEISEAGSLDELSRQLEADSEVDLVLLDLAMPGVRGLSGLLYLRAQYPAIPVVVVSASEDDVTIRRCIEFGASAFVPKSLPVSEIRAAIRDVLDGEIWTPPDIELGGETDDDTADLVSRLQKLTPQQVRVLMMLSEGLLNKQIAFHLNVSEATVKAHVSAILQKLDVDSRTQAVIAVSRIEGSDWQKPAN
jgi:DNA-binding NarL/FixJ family response regulator